MDVSIDMIYDIKRKILAKYPRFGSEIANCNIEFNEDLQFHTAATDGKNIYIDPKYFASLDDSDRMFLIAHEVMHIKFMHMFRLRDSNGNERDLKLWNIATDAIINANLERDGFTIKKGYVNMPEALKYSAEKLYQILLQEKQQKDNNIGMEQNDDEANTSSENGEIKNKNQQTDINGDDHTLWKKAFESKEKNDNNQQRSNLEESNSSKKQKFQIDEKNEFADNRKEKRQRFENRRKKVEKDIIEKKQATIKIDNVGESQEEIDWKLLIRREIDRTETLWSQRRSIVENNYAYRLEEYDIDDEAETEVMIDISGSVKLELVKAFLRQIKSLLKHSKLRVGCFNEKFWGFVNIKDAKDIDSFLIPSEARGDSSWTEDWDLAVRSFTKKREINKIVFTDGYPCPGTMPKNDLKNENIIWLVYGNKKFNPCCGKVINITEKQLKKLQSININSSMKDIR